MSRFRHRAAIAVATIAVECSGGRRRDRGDAAERRGGAATRAPTRRPGDRDAGQRAAGEDDSRGEAAADLAAARLQGIGRRDPQGPRLGPERHRPGADQQDAAHRRRGDAAEDPAAVRLRHDPWVPDRVPDPARHRRELRSERREHGRQDRRPRVRRRRHQADLRADGRRLARAALGPHLGGRGGGSLPELGDGRRTRQGHPGPGLQRARQADRQPEALRRVRRAGGRARLRDHRHVRAAAAEHVPAAVQGRGRRRRRHVHVLVQFAERLAGLRQQLPDERHPQG